MKVLFQDKDIIVCIKPAGVLSTDEAGGMPDLIREQLGSDLKVWTVHRLDSVVAGLMVYALSSEAASSLSHQIEEGGFRKVYYAVLEGRPEKEAGKLTDYLRRNTKERKTIAVPKPGKGAEDAALLYKTVKKTPSLTLVRVELITGRTHQIRAQFSSRHLPLYGDRKYGAANTDARIALWSCSLSFRHPMTGKAMKFTALPPEVMPWQLFPGCHEAYKEEDVVREFARSRKLSDCPYAESCGECAYQGLDYERQLIKKQKLAQKWLKPYGEVSEIIVSDMPLHYKNKITRTFAVSRNGKIISGIIAKAGRKFVPVSSCLIENEAAEPVITTFRKLMDSYHLLPFDADTQTGLIRQITLQISGLNGDMMLTITAQSEGSKDVKVPEDFIRELVLLHPQIRTVLLRSGSSPNAQTDKEDILLYGQDTIHDSLCGSTYELTGRSYFPDNALLAEALYKTAISLAGLTGKERVLNLYAGSGLLGIALAPLAERVICIDRSSGNISEGSRHAKEAGNLKNIRFKTSVPKDYVCALARSHEQIDAVFLDGTHGRIETGIMKDLISLAPGKIICISDDPEKLAGELAFLKDSAYAIEKIQPADLAPFTKKAGIVVSAVLKKD